MAAKAQISLCVLVVFLFLLVATEFAAARELAGSDGSGNYGGGLAPPGASYPTTPFPPY
ncbi:hypothetical protein BRADI_2g20127v3 [Brachypodium distachyon]|uniref:Uncharacterized protein n=1 Tax=Brachypodium distachyon TaxID=15368 RepID=I1HHQ8_BRADI|nr:hypothetical protein BRADI_2g20127v3 [Brachypodium distachyon]